MNIISLPDDMISNIISLLPNNKQRIYNTTVILPNSDRLRIKHRLIRSMLYIKLSFHIKYLFRRLQMSLFAIGGPLGWFYNNKCLYYSPYIQYGLCRFCNQHLYQHRYTKMMRIFHSIT